MSTLESKMKERIHLFGEKTDGTLIGGYSSMWAAQRRAKGVQTDYVDLNYEGNMQASLQTGESQGMPVLGFDSEEQYKKARINSYGNGFWDGFGEIYTPNEDEIDDLTNAYVTQLDREFNALR